MSNEAQIVQQMAWENEREDGAWEELSGDQCLELAYELHDFILGEHPSQVKS